MIEQLEEVSMTVSQENINAYAELTDDFNPLHVDPAFAAGTPMGNTIAHGTLSLNLIWQSLARSFDKSLLERFDVDVRFLKPAYAGGTIIAGGQRNADEPHQYDVWVKDPQGSTLISGYVTLSQTK